MKSLYRKLINNYWLVALAVILLLLGVNFYPWLVVLCCYLFYLFKKEKTILFFSLFLMTIILAGYFIIYFREKYLIDAFKDTITGKVIMLKKANTYQLITLRYKGFHVQVKDYDFSQLKLGSIIKVTGFKIDAGKKHLPYGFSQDRYLFNHLCLYRISATSIVFLEKKFTLNIFNHLLQQYLNRYFQDEALLFLEAFVLGDTSNFSASLLSDLKINGIIHLFAISGLHVSIIILLFKKLFKENKFCDILLMTMLAFYLVVTKFTISVSRAVVTYFLKKALKKHKYTSLDVTSIVFCLFLVLNPFVCYQLGFVLSFFATFIIIFLNKHLKGKNEFTSILIITSVINGIMLPVTINLNNNINLLVPVLNLIMIFLTETLILPLTFLVFLLPLFAPVYSLLIKAFLKINASLAQFAGNAGCVILVASLSAMMMLLFYLLLSGIILFKKKIPFIVLGIILLLFVFLKGSYAFYPQITFFDLYEGEATLLSYKDENILIDTGVGYRDELTETLLKMGIKEIDYMFITHNHKDHNGEAVTIINKIRVRRIFVSEVDASFIGMYPQAARIRQKERLKTKHADIVCLMPFRKDENENNNSLILHITLGGVKFLFTGDAEEKEEEMLPECDVDILKVAHHGSDTSTTSMFLVKTKPKYAIIMTGRRNKDKFPSPSVIKRLKENNVKTYCTKTNYTITLKIKRNQTLIFDFMGDASFYN